MGITSLLTWGIIGANALMTYIAFQDSNKFYKWDLNPPRVFRQNEYWRLVSSGFIHANWPHLFFNMFSLFFFLRPLADFSYAYYGNTGVYVLLGFYLLAIIISNLPSLIKHRADHYYHSVGASGGVSAVIFAFIMLAPTQTIYVFFFPLPGFVFAILYLIYSAYMSKQSKDTINHDAHFYGALFGMLGIMMVEPGTIEHFFSSIINYRPF